MSDHLWIQDGERIVCTECGLDLDAWLMGVPHDKS